MTMKITLPDGTTIPQLGFGTYLLPAGETAATVAEALSVGYRHIDTAQMYGNEKGVGEAIAESGIARDELYVTTKLANNAHAPAAVKRTFDDSMKDLRLDTLDLFLMHWPLPTRYDGDFVSTWRAMGEILEEGRVRSIGVSNFNPAHLERIIDETGIVPAVNQIEVHPYFLNSAARDASSAHGIAVEAWGPLGQGNVIEDETIAQIATEIGKAPTQVILRWHIQRGDIIFPKSIKRERMEQNFALFDFALTPETMARIDALDKGDSGRNGGNPDTFDWV